MFLGSSIGNFSREGAEEFLRSLPLRAESGDTLLLGLDHNTEGSVIKEAYNDSKGYATCFVMNGLKAAGRTLGDENLFDEDNWEYVNQYVAVFESFLLSYGSDCLPSISVETPTGGLSQVQEGTFHKSTSHWQTH
jgi:uncharacterized SAM-dependent methyltransferase